MTTMPFDLTAQTKVATDQFLTILSQTQRAAIATVKTVSSLTSPIVEKLPEMPYAPAKADFADLAAFVDSGFAAMAAFLDSQKVFTAELLEVLAPAKAPAKASAAKK